MKFAFTAPIFSLVPVAVSSQLSSAIVTVLVCTLVIIFPTHSRWLKNGVERNTAQGHNSVRSIVYFLHFPLFFLLFKKSFFPFFSFFFFLFFTFFFSFFFLFFSLFFPFFSPCFSFVFSFSSPSPFFFPFFFSFFFFFFLLSFFFSFFSFFLFFLFFPFFPFFLFSFFPFYLFSFFPFLFCVNVRPLLASSPHSRVSQCLFFSCTSASLVTVQCAHLSNHSSNVHAWLKESLEERHICPHVNINPSQYVSHGGGAAVPFHPRCR